MGTAKRDDWRGFVGVIHSRRSTVLFALLLITIGLMTYSFHNTTEVDSLYHGDSSINAQEDDHTEKSQQPQDPSVLFDGFPVSKPPIDSETVEDSVENTLVIESSLNSSIVASLQNVPTLPTPLGSGIPLRVMFLGASVVRGDVSVGNLGFRSPLRDRLVSLGNPVNLVGSQRLGAFKDNDLEAYPGNRIDQIHDHATLIVPSTKPNVFVIHVGSNDCLQKHDTANAGKRMRDLIAYLFKTSPKATVIISTLLTNTVPNKEPCILDINIQIRKLASALQREGRPVVFAEMHCEQGLPNRPWPADISPDGTHPFDHGYALMADIFFSAFVDADRRGFLKAPEENGIPDDGELERIDELFIVESEPPKKRPNPPKDEKVVENKNAAPKSTLEVIPNTI
ncbi:carbohydrate esterase family 3 protein [Xylaria digitata]|nr:carbohydrate esterase family 3 protein [Xylaria digitata]